MLETYKKKRVSITTTRSFLTCLKNGKIGDALPPFEFDNGAECVSEHVLQRPKMVVFEGLVRMVVGNEVDWSRKVRRTRRIGRTKRG